MEYTIGQEFVGFYPPEAAIYATQNGLRIVESGSRGSKTVYKIEKVTRSKDQLLAEIKSKFKSLQKEDSDAHVTYKGFRVNANTISLNRDQILLENFEENSTMGSMIFIDYDNNKQMITKEDLEKIIKGIKRFQIFLVQRKSEIQETVNGLTDDEVQTFDVSKVFDYEVSEGR